jgi:hypothetical protein
MAHQADLGSWVRSTRCDTGTCLEATTDNDDVVIRNSTDPDGARISVSRARWAAFVADLKSRAVLAQ